MYAHVFIDRSLPQIDQLYSYQIEEDIEEFVQVGKRVIVPFGRGNKKTIAIIIKITDNLEGQHSVKKIEEIIDKEPVLSKESIELGLYMRSKYLVDYSQAFRPLLPEKIIGQIEEKYLLIDSDKELFKDIFGTKNFVLASELNDEEKIILREAVDEKKLALGFSLKNKVEKRKTTYYKYKEVESIELSQKQSLVIDLLKREGPLSKKEIMDQLSISSSPVDSLLKKSYIEEVFNRGQLNDEKIQKRPLNPEQKKTFYDIIGSSRRGHLLYGITGSGKTEVYLDLVEYFYKKGKTSIILVPEISLTPQTLRRFQQRFGDDISVLHSRLSHGEKTEEWLKIRDGKSKIIIGARSAIFAPISNLGIVIIDEEQEESYSYHNSLRYDTIEVAEKLAEIHGAKIVLGSATPSIESFYRARETKELDIHRLTKRANPLAQRPTIEIVDMREELEKGNTSIFSSKLLESLEECLGKNEQSILFLNRRGYSNFISCRACGHVIKCNNCDISMTYHKNINGLRCHYCGTYAPLPQKCPECGSKYIKKFGIGTEQVEEEVRRYFPEANILRMDRDTMQKKHSYTDVYEAMNRGEIDILIGTQMLAKGFDFKNLTFVGIIAADTSLFIPDFRAQERTYQLLTQVSGRAGRDLIPGKAIIQTYSPNNYSISLAQKDEYEYFFEKEIELRKQYFYPPFSKILRVKVSAPSQTRVDQVSNRWFNTFKEISIKEKIEIDLLGPSSLPKIKNLFSSELAVKVSLDQHELLLQVMRRVLYNYYKKMNERDVKINIEID